MLHLGCHTITAAYNPLAKTDHIAPDSCKVVQKYNPPVYPGQENKRSVCTRSLFHNEAFFSVISILTTCPPSLLY